jgi:hypothetical protein
MNPEEQKQILKMVEDGKITAEEALKLIRAVESSSLVGNSLSISAPEPEMESDLGKPGSKDFEDIAIKARRLWQIPLWVGVTVIVLSAYWLYTFVRASNFVFWFYFAFLPLLLGLSVLALFAGSRTERWLYVNIEQPRDHWDHWPRNISIGFPLPLGPASWFLRNFGHSIEGLDREAVEEILKFLSEGFSTNEPLVVNVDETSGGERVRVYIS